jgi:hypothetical protein
MLGQDCWFCDKGGDLVFDREFDTPVHLACIRQVLDTHPEHTEAQLMAYLLEDEQ